MYNSDFNTSISIMGHAVYITYTVDQNWTVDWYLTPTEYAMPRDELPDTLVRGLECFETLLRTHWSGYIRQELLNEFEARQYEEEARLSALAEMEMNRIF